MQVRQSPINQGSNLNHPVVRCRCILPSVTKNLKKRTSGPELMGNAHAPTSRNNSRPPCRTSLTWHMDRSGSCFSTKLDPSVKCYVQGVMHQTSWSELSKHHSGARSRESELIRRETAQSLVLDSPGHDAQPIRWSACHIPDREPI